MTWTLVTFLTLASPSLERGLAAFEALDFDAASASLEQAMKGRDYAYDDVVRLLSAVGVTRAFTGNATGAREAFRRLLAVDPGYVLSYTTSPKATFLFEEERKAMRQLRSVEIAVTLAAFGELGEPVALECTRVADPLDMIARIEVLHRDKSAENFSRTELPAPPIGNASVVHVPTPPSRADASNAILQVAVHGYDAAGWEVYQGPTSTRPKEFALGLRQATPWYGRWWVWAIVGGVAAGTTAGVLLATRPEPADVPARYSIGR